MCSNNCKKVDGFKFICRHMDGTEIVFTIPAECTWRELGTQFRNFVLAAGYIIDRTDCICEAEQPELPLIDDMHCEGCKCNEAEASYDGVPT